jgi:hypothetical protein
MNEIIQKFSPKDYLAVLPSTSRDYITSLVESGTEPIDLALKLSLEPGEGLATKGGELWPKDIFPRLIQELHTLICTDDKKYEAIREKIKGEATTSANVIVFVISDAIAIHAGMAPALCVPLVALILASIAKAGIAAWCKAFKPVVP